MPIQPLEFSVIAGTAVIFLATLITALLYRGKQGERFSPLNHFISELGELGVSRAARIFNYGLVLGGLLTIPYILTLGRAFGSLLGWLGVGAGVITTLGVSAVGLFPMNNLRSHGIAAFTFFRAGLLMVFFFGLAILLQPAGQVIIPKRANVITLLALASYGSFLGLVTRWKPGEKQENALDPEQEIQRPRVWPVAIIEWLVFITTILWIFAMTFQL